MKINSTILIVFIIILVTLFYIWTAMPAKQKQDDILKSFKEIDSSLASGYDSVTIRDEMNMAEKNFPVASLKSEAVLLIDSLKDNYNALPESADASNETKKMRPDIDRLLGEIQKLNKLKWDSMDSDVPDTVKYWPYREKFSEQKWLIDFFENNSKEQVITYLNYLRNQILSVQ